ncbi:hypothetical protein O0Q47_RS24205, partial [Escherichia coli]
AARQGDSSARVCGDNQKRYTPGFTALTERGVVPSWSLVRCDGGRNWILLQLITIIIFCGSFPAIRAVTGRRTRGFSLFMKIFRDPCPVSLQVNYMKNIKTGLL